MKRSSGPRRLSTLRVRLAAAGFLAVFLAIGGKLILLGALPDPQNKARFDAEAALATRRPDIYDRDGRLLATDIQAASIFAEPNRMIDPDEAAEEIAAVLPDINAKALHESFSNKKSGFVWVRREVTPKQQREVHRLGIPGIDFLNEQRRIYPNGDLVSHAIGSVNIDNQGIAGFEKYLDRVHDVSTDGKTRPKPVEMSLDLVVQQAVRDELAKGLAKYKAKAASGLVMNVNTGEVIAFVSLPDYDPNVPADALKPNNINRLSVGVYEMGSTFKALTLAMALDSGKVKLTDRFDARQPLSYGGFKIHDFHATHRILNVPEVFVHSSNIGTARIAMEVGVDGHKAFLKKMGLLDRLQTELPESASPIVPKNWGTLNTITISFGHGLSVTPLQTLAATDALVNGGYLMKPTFIKRTHEEAMKEAKRVIKPETVAKMRYLMRLNAQIGSARQADIPGYRVGGKTGTAEKVINGRYSNDKVMCAFTAIFPSDKPEYSLLVMIDEPQGIPETHGFHTSGWNAAPMTGKIVARIAPLLGVVPDFNPPPNDPPGVAAASLVVNGE